MALTLLEASKLSTDVLQKGVIEVFARTSPVLELLPFLEISGNSYKYNVEKALPGVAFRDVNNGYTPSEGEVEQHTEGLTILGGEVDVDRYIVQTRGNINDIRAIQTNLKSKSLAKTFTNTFFHGNSATNPLEFDGLGVRLAGTSQEIFADGAGTVGATLSLDNLHELLDSVDGGADVLFMSKAMRRELQKLLGQSTHYIQSGTDEFGRVVEYFGDVQIRTVEDEFLPFTETVGADTVCGSIYAVKFGAEEYVCGLRNGDVSVRDLGELDTLPVFRTRIEFYCGAAMFHPKSAAVLKGVKRA